MISGDSLSIEWLRNKVTELMVGFSFEEEDAKLEEEGGERGVVELEPLLTFSLPSILEFEFEFEDLMTGPYSQVTSESFDQLRSSGEMVFKPNLVWAHVLHDAFSNLAESATFFLLKMTYFQDLDISSSAHL